MGVGFLPLLVILHGFPLQSHISLTHTLENYWCMALTCVLPELPYVFHTLTDAHIDTSVCDPGPVP